MQTKNIMIVGVGGQGTLLASKLLGRILLSKGYDVKVSEVHGMSQRGGSVVTYVRYGNKVYSPVIALGEADFIVSFEKLKANGADVFAFDALSLAAEAGTARAVNIVLLGKFAKETDIPADKWIEAIKACVKPQFIDVNVKAFNLGYGIE